MLITRLLSFLGCIIFTSPALAEYFIVQEPGTNRCSVAGQSPAPDAGSVVGDGAYEEQAAAEADMRAIAACAGNRQQELALTVPNSAFFIVQQPGTNRCTIVEKGPGSGSVVVFGDATQGDRPPEGSSPVIVGDGAYGNRPTAEGEMRKIAACATTGQ
jgi:hypothetical protein